MEKEKNPQKLADDLENNLINLRAIMSNSSDLTIKNAKAGGVAICIIFCEGMVSTGTMANLIFRPLNAVGNEQKLSEQELMIKLEDELIIAGEQKRVDTYEELMQAIMSGFVVILVNAVAHAIAIGVQGYASRSVEKPSTHNNVRASRDGFVEVIRTNVSLVRRRMKSPNMVFKMTTVGDLSNTDVCICYLKNKADPKIVDEVSRRIKDIPLNTILEGGYIQPFLEDNGDALFSEVGATERPDTFVSKLFDGRIGILVDGSPFALYVPKLFMENFTVVDDYTGRPAYTLVMRVLRYLAALSAVLLPGFYVALANFNPELFPHSLLLNLSSSIQDTPYPLLAECLLIHLFYEMMREAGLRLPEAVGHTVSIVGGLVIGDIVVSAGLVGAPMVLIVALAGITSYVVPDIYDSLMLMRFVFIIIGGMWGLFGITLAGAVFTLKLCSQEAYGVPHTVPVSPFSRSAMRDFIIRVGWRRLAKYDNTIQNLNGVNVKGMGK